MLANKLKHSLRTVPNFPKNGISFKDITPILKEPELVKELISYMSQCVADSDAEAIMGIEARGFILAVPIAMKLSLPFIPARKPGKLPFTTVSESYKLEYGETSLEIHNDSFSSNTNVAIVDDLLATGGTAEAAGKLVEKLNGKIAGYFFAIELLELNGRETINSNSISSVLKI